MTDLEWQKYVEKVARTVFVPEWGMFYVPKKIIANAEPVLNIVKSDESKNEIKLKEDLTFTTKEYKFKGRTYKRRVVDSYNRTYKGDKND